MKAVNCSGFSDKKLTEEILRASDKCKLYYEDVKTESSIIVSNPFDWTILRLKPDNIARVVPSVTTVVKFFPSTDVSMVSVGNKQGRIGFWNVNGEKENRVHLYHPHPGWISGIVIHPIFLSKVYSSCYQGFIRLMNVEKQVFESVYSGHCISSLSHRQSDANFLYFGEENGVFHIWDTREGKLSVSCNLHGHNINSVDFSSVNANIMATSSIDEAACIWDLRYTSVDNPMALQRDHNTAVNSAYFSPSGTYLATTRYSSSTHAMCNSLLESYLKAYYSDGEFVQV